MIKLNSLKVKPQRLAFGPNFNWELLHMIPASDLRDINWRQASLKAPAPFIFRNRNKFPWNWSEVTLSEQFHLEMMLTYNLPIVMRVAHLRHDFTFAVYERNITRNWDHTAISRMDEFPLSLIIKTGKRFIELWDWEAISKNPQYSMALANEYGLPYSVSAYVNELDGSFRESDVFRYPNVHWDASDLAEHTSRVFYERTPHLNWDAVALSKVRWNVFDLLTDSSGWDYDQLSSNEHLTLDLLRQSHPWNMASATMLFSPDVVIENPDIPWELTITVRHEEFTADHVRSAPDIPWPWRMMHRCNWFDGQFVLEFHDKPWRLAEMIQDCSHILSTIADAFIETFDERLDDINLRALTPYTMLQTIKKHKSLRWDWEYVARKFTLDSNDLDELPNLPHELICENPRFIDLSAALLEEFATMTD
jgi:hypothetical protein